MKHLPEKLVMAAIILSCGLFAHSDPSAGDHKVKRAGSAKPSLKHQDPAPDQAVDLQRHTLARKVTARFEKP